MPKVLGDDFDRIVTVFDGENPYGIDAKYESEYVDLRAEIQKLTAASSKETTIDWKAIKKWSIEVLTTQSKDLTVSCYLTLSLFILHGYAGLFDGLSVVDKMVTDHWDDLFPPKKKLRPRVLAFDWLEFFVCLESAEQRLLLLHCYA